MRDIRLDNITTAAEASFAGLAEPRRRELVQALVRHLHGYAREVALTHAEWRGALAFLHIGAGAIWLAGAGAMVATLAAWRLARREARSI